jgi:hypothetical protein
MALALLTEAQAEKDTGMPADEWMRHHDRGLQQQAGSAGHPGLGHVVREPFDFDLDTVFEYGLQRLLDGNRRPAPRPRAPITSCRPA